MVVYSPAKRSSDAWMVGFLAVPAMAAYCAPRSQSWSELKVVRGGETSTGTSAIWVEKPRRADGASLKRAADGRVQRISLMFHDIFVIRFGVKQIRFPWHQSRGISHSTPTFTTGPCSSSRLNAACNRCYVTPDHRNADVSSISVACHRARGCPGSQSTAGRQAEALTSGPRPAERSVIRAAGVQVAISKTAPRVQLCQTTAHLPVSRVTETGTPISPHPSERRSGTHCADLFRLSPARGWRRA